MKVVKLVIDENSELDGIDAVALVAEPAIEVDFQMFSKQYFQSFDDYPKAAIEAAKQGIKRNAESGNKCGTQVGKVRAQQLAQGKPVSLDTIKRMRAFLIRQKDNYDLAIKRKDYNACGYISYLLWGGPAALPWAEKKLRQAGLLEEANEEIIRDEMTKFVDAAGGFSVGDYVSWTFAGRGKDADRGRGQITDIRVSGTVKIPGSDFEFKPTKERPLALIKTRQGKTVGQYTENLRKIQKPEGFAIEYIDNVPVFEDSDTAIQVSKMIGCGGQVHEHLVGGKTLYMPCLKHSEAIAKLKNKNEEQFEQKYFDDLSDDKKEQLLSKLNLVGLDATSLLNEGWIEVEEDQFNNYLFATIVSDPDKGSLQDTLEYRVLYKYEGPRDSKNRDFCRELLSKDLLFRIEDINNMSLQGANEEFSTYDIFTYKGSYNCRHRWVQKFYKKDKSVSDQGRAAQVIENILGGPRAQEAAQTNPKSRTQAEVEAGVPAGQFEFAQQLKEQKLVAGPLMIADKLIPRIDENGEKYYVFFDADGIKKLSYKLMRNKLIDSVNIEHDPDRKVDDITLVETWLVEDSEQDKSNLYGYNLPKGSWFGIYKVNNEDVWENYIKTGKVAGFSIEGLFSDKVIMANAEVKEQFVTKKPYERKDDYMARCIPFLIENEGYKPDQAAAICSTDYDKQ